MDNDDRLVGRVLNRREVLALFGGAGALALLGGCSDDDDTAAAATPTPTPSPVGQPTGTATTPTETAGISPTSIPNCVVRPELTEGPYFVDGRMERSDIREDTSDGSIAEGAELRLIVNAIDVSGGQCAPLPGAIVDIWHCDAAGVYSDAVDPRFNTVGRDFLRGYQITAASGRAEFLTIYPGWYRGRAVHIHFKLRTGFEAGAGEFTSQWFFDEAMTDLVHAEEPYASTGYRTLLNDGDGIYRQGGEDLTLDVVREGSAYVATFDIGVDLG